MQVDEQDMKKLRAEFSKIDKDGDGTVDKREMSRFLAEKGVDEDHIVEIVDEIFKMCDADGNQRIELSEFIQHYITTKNQLLQKDVENTQYILDLHNEIVKMQQEL